MTATLLVEPPRPAVRKPAAAPPAVSRLAYLDVFRGLLTVLMSLDHAIYFLWGSAQEHSFTFWYGPFAYEETPAELVVRLLSNLAAPGFFFLLGAGLVMYARARRKLGWSDGAIARHFVLRGAVLIGLQFVVENALWSLKPEASMWSYVGVLFALGGAMILSAAVWRLPSWALVGLGAACVGLQEIVVSMRPEVGASTSVVAALLLLPGKTSGLHVYFACLPWFGIAAWGIGYGRALVDDSRRTLKIGGWIGALMFAASIVIVALRGFGNSGVVDTGGLTGYLAMVKYGPSVAFVGWNVGLTLMALTGTAWLVERFGAPRGPLTAFGRSALFFYVAHLLLYGIVSLLLGPGGTEPGAATAMWLVGLLLLWPACALYARFKASTGPDSIWRLF